MSERITAANLDEVIKRNEVIEEQMKQSASLIWSKYNPMQINSPIQLALQILRPYGLIQLPIDNHYLSGAIFVRDGKRIPLINTALPRANQYTEAPMLSSFGHKGILFVGLMKQSTVLLSMMKM